MHVKPTQGVPFKSNVSKHVTVEAEQSSPDEDKIIIKDDSSEENIECMHVAVRTSFIKTPIVSIDTDSDDSASVRVS